MPADTAASRKPRVLHLPAREHTAKVFTPAAWARLQGAFEVTRNDGDGDLTEAEICSLIGGHDALITGWAAPASGGPPPITPAIMEAADRLRIIAHSAGSVRRMLHRVWEDHVVPRRICVFTSTAAIAYNVAETTLGLIIMSAKRLMEHALHVRGTGGWRAPEIPVGEQYLTGGIVGIVGASDVGREVIRVLRPLAGRILVYDPFLDADDAQPLQVEKAELNDLFARSDIVSLHAPSIPETDRMVGAEQLSLLRDGAVLVNTARGSLVDHDALIEEAATGRIRVALDVTTPEPPPADSPLRAMPNVILTPHVAGHGRYGHRRIGDATVAALKDFFAGRPVTGAIDPDHWERLA